MFTGIDENFLQFSMPSFDQIMIVYKKKYNIKLKLYFT